MGFLGKTTTEGLKGKGFDLFKLFPVVVVVANHHGHELGGLEERQDLPSTHFQETRREGRVLLIHRVREDVSQVRIHKLLPETHTKVQ